MTRIEAQGASGLGSERHEGSPWTQVGVSIVTALLVLALGLLLVGVTSDSAEILPVTGGASSANPLR